MERLEDMEERIRGYLLEELSEEQCPVDFAESDHDEEDHVSESDHNTATDIDDTDADPNYSPSEEEPEDLDEKILQKSIKKGFERREKNSVDKTIENVAQGNFDIARYEMEMDTSEALDDMDIIPPSDNEDFIQSFSFKFCNNRATIAHQVRDVADLNNPDRDTVINTDRDIVNNPDKDTISNSDKDTVIYPKIDTVNNPKIDTVNNPEMYTMNNPQRDTVLEVMNQVVAGTAGVVQININEFIGRDKTTRWKKVPFSRPNVHTRSVNLVRRLPGPINEAKLAKSPLECFQLMISDNIIENIVGNTNRYIEMKSVHLSRERDGKPTDETEIKSVIGLLILAGMMRSGHQNLIDLWSRDGFGVEVFYSTMSLKRFTFLIQCMRFDNLFDRFARRKLDKFAPFREVFELFVDNCKKYFAVSACTTIDEQLVPFRGRCSFRQFIKSKPAKYGLKIFTLTDARLFYVKDMELYVGNQLDGSPYKQSNSPKDVVLRLSKCISGSGRNIMADNWFSNVQLASDLLQKNLTYVGTVRKNKRELPPELVEKKRVANDSIFAFQENMTLVLYAPKKNRSVVMISTMHSDASIDEISGDQRKPEIIMFYNSTKSEVDVVDEKCGTYSTSRRCAQWPLVLFYRLLDIGGINAQVIHSFNNQEPNGRMVRRKFLKEIGMSLAKPQIIRRTTVDCLPKQLSQSVTKLSGIVQPRNEQPIQPPNVKARCSVCPRQKDAKTKFKCETCKKPMCQRHMKDICETCLNDLLHGQNNDDH